MPIRAVTAVMLIPVAEIQSRAVSLLRLEKSPRIRVATCFRLVENPSRDVVTHSPLARIGRLPRREVPSRASACLSLRFS